MNLRPLLLALCCFAASAISANNIRVENLEIVIHNPGANLYTLEFDLSWDNSWRTSSYEANWDAAWIFLKFTQQNQHQWLHGELLVNSDDPLVDGHTVPPGARIEIPSDGKGCFIYRDSDGTGDVVFENIRLIWDYNGEPISDSDLLEISLQAVEMVYVPEGEFYLGDGSGENLGFRAGTSDDPFLVDGEDTAYTLGGSAISHLGNGAPSGILDAENGDDFNEGITRILPADWPIGYHAMYVMKYEVSRAQYAEFLMMATELQRGNLTPECDPGTYGEGFWDNDLPEFFTYNPIADVGNHYAVPNLPYYPVNCLTWIQCAAFLDWSGLRPLSETEFEKAARGPLEPVPGEYAWGNTDAFLPFEEQGGPHFPYVYVNPGEANETIAEGLSQTSGNAYVLKADIYLADGCPTCPKSGLGRVGSIAASMENPTRTNTGASYYGIMEMSGNAQEPVISLGRPGSRDFTGMHGDGEITAVGDPSGELIGDWANYAADGIMKRSLLVSNRLKSFEWGYDPGGFQTDIYLAWLQGIRGCRTAHE